MASDLALTWDEECVAGGKSRADRPEAASCLYLARPLVVFLVCRSGKVAGCFGMQEKGRSYNTVDWLCLDSCAAFLAVTERHGVASGSSTNAVRGVTG